MNPTPFADIFEKDLVARLQSKNPFDRAEAWEIFLAKYSERLKSHISRKLYIYGDRPDLRDDIFQDVFIIAFEKIDQFLWRGQGSFYGWLLAIAQRCCWSAVHAENAHPTIPIDDLPESILATDSDLVTVDMLIDIADKMSYLSKREQETMALYSLGYSQKEIADFLGVDIRTAYQYATRIRSKLVCLLQR